MAKEMITHMEQMAQMMQVIMRLSRKKRVVDDASSMNTATRVQRITKGPNYRPANFVMSKVGTPHCPVPPMENAIPN